jgi:hypothetical protein
MGTRNATCDKRRAWHYVHRVDRRDNLWICLQALSNNLLLARQVNNHSSPTYILLALILSAVWLGSCRRDNLPMQEEHSRADTGTLVSDTTSLASASNVMGVGEDSIQPDFGMARTILSVDSTTTLLLLPVPRELWTDYVLAVRHRGSITATRRIRGGWLDSIDAGFDPDFRFIEPPIFQLRDVDGDTRPELLIKDRQHNGTWNAASLHVYRVSPQKLSYVGSFEYILHISTDELFLTREWDFNSNRVDVFVSEYLRSKERTRVGTFEIDVTDGLRFRNETVIDERYAYALLPDTSTVWRDDSW